mmetsp:Transcript_90480/g.151358  ORF Transcript_90480/g.151358 Transcript_90480/m.151358 type:complete len:88 (+) Transcript_90480:162-425(+)
MKATGVMNTPHSPKSSLTSITVGTSPLDSGQTHPRVEATLRAQVPLCFAALTCGCAGPPPFKNHGSSFHGFVWDSPGFFVHNSAVRR